MLSQSQIFTSRKEGPDFLNFLSSFERKINDPAQSMGVYESILNYLILNPNIDIHQRFSSLEARKKRMEIHSPLCLLARSFCFNLDMSVINSNKNFLLGKEPGIAYPDSLDKLKPEHFYTFKTNTGERVFDFDSCMAVLMLMGMDPWEHSPNQQKNEIPETIQWLLARDAGRLLDLALKMPKAKTLNYDWATLMNAEIHPTLQTKNRRTWWDYACSVERFADYAGNVVEHCFKNNVYPEVNPNKYTDYPLLGCHISVLKLALDFGMIPLDEKFSQLFKKKWAQSQKNLNISPQQFNEGISLLFQNHDNISTVDSLEQERIKGLIRFHILSKKMDHREQYAILHPDNIPFEDLNVQVPMTIHGIQGDWSPLAATLWYESLNKLSRVNHSFSHIAQCLREYEGIDISQGVQMVRDIQQQKINPYFSGLNLLSMVEPPQMFFSNAEESLEANHQLKIETNRTLYAYLLEKLDMKNKRVEPSVYRLIEKAFVHQDQKFYHDNPVFIGTKKQDMDFCLSLNEAIHFRHRTEKSAKIKSDISECIKIAFHLNEFLRKDLRKYISTLDGKEQLDKYVQWFNYYLANKNLNPTVTQYVDNESREHYEERTQTRSDVMKYTLSLLEKKDGLDKSALIHKIEVMSELVLDKKNQDDHFLISKIKELDLQQRVKKLSTQPSFSNTTISRF